jgi:hypothetical protein
LLRAAARTQLQRLIGVWRSCRNAATTKVGGGGGGLQPRFRVSRHGDFKFSDLHLKLFTLAPFESALASHAAKKEFRAALAPTAGLVELVVAKLGKLLPEGSCIFTAANDNVAASASQGPRRAAGPAAPGTSPWTGATLLAGAVQADHGMAAWLGCKATKHDLILLFSADTDLALNPLALSCRARVLVRLEVDFKFLCACYAVISLDGATGMVCVRGWCARTAVGVQLVCVRGCCARTAVGVQLVPAREHRAPVRLLCLQPDRCLGRPSIGWFERPPTAPVRACAVWR